MYVYMHMSPKDKKKNQDIKRNEQPLNVSFPTVESVEHMICME